jgi:hypothetical protein
LLQTFYGRHNLLFDRNEIPISQMEMELFPFYLYLSFRNHIQDFHRTMSYTVGVFFCIFFVFFVCNFHFLQTLQTILNNYTTRQNILANYKITLWVSCFVFVYPQTVSYVPNVAHVFGFTIHDYSLTIIRR